MVNGAWKSGRGSGKADGEWYCFQYFSIFLKLQKVSNPQHFLVVFILQSITKRAINALPFRSAKWIEKQWGMHGKDYHLFVFSSVCSLMLPNDSLQACSCPHIG